MNNALKSPKNIMLGSLFILAVTAIAWQTKDSTNKKGNTATAKQAGDTTRPGKRSNGKDEFRMKDLDTAMKDLDIQLKDLDVHLKDLDIDLSKEINNAISKIDLEEIRKEVEKSLKEIDAEKITKEVQDEIKKIDFDKIKIEINNALKDAQVEVKKVDMEKVKQQMQELKQSMNSGKFKQQMDDAMKGAKEAIQNAKEQLQELKQFTDELQKDGLIDKKKGYSIEWKNGGDLYINGNKQSKEVSNKYKKYYKEDGYNFKMNADDNDDEGEAM